MRRSNPGQADGAAPHPPGGDFDRSIYTLYTTSGHLPPDGNTRHCSGNWYFTAQAVVATYNQLVVRVLIKMGAKVNEERGSGMVRLLVWRQPRATLKCWSCW